MSESNRSLAIEGMRENIVRAVIIGPEAHIPEQFSGFEDDLRSRNSLRERYGIDAAIEGETSEFRQILKLRHWVHCQWPIDDTQEFSGDAFAILEKARTGAGFHCAHSMIVQQAVLSAFGFVARNLGVDRDHRDLGRSCHHGVNEVWSNDYAKWVALDAKYDIHFEREDGVPLSARELHEAARSDNGRGVVKVQGPDRSPLPMEDPNRTEGSVRSYWWVSYHTHAPAFARRDWSDGAKLVVFDTPAFRQSTWYRRNGDKQVPHWAYAADAFIRAQERHEIEWTPGVPMLRVRQADAAELDVRFHSATPAFQEYRIRTPGRPWQPCPDGQIRWRLDSPVNRLEVRVRNRFGVEGPLVLAKVETR